MLRTVLRERVAVVGSGRTDAGVHALAQVAHVRTGSRLLCARLLRSINALLPRDIAVMSVEDAPEGFHARYDATGKTYRYRIYTGPVVPPFIRPYVWQVRAPLSVSRMRRAARVLRGRHDFGAFAKQGGGGRSTVRRLHRVRLKQLDEELVLELTGDGFLHTMVRSMVGTLVEIGRGRLPVKTVRDMLRRRTRWLAGGTAPARGLILVGVTYRARSPRGRARSRIGSGIRFPQARWRRRPGTS